MAILIAEALGIEQYLQQVWIYATDVDPVAISHARQSFYSSSAVAGVPSALLKKYFEPTEQGYIFNRKLRSRVFFARHNLLEDAPMSKLDLLVCRNTLMYFNSEAQAKISTRFHFALNDFGFLFLGKAETLTNSTLLPEETSERTLSSFSSFFTCISLKHRIFTKGSKLGLDQVLLLKNKTYSGKAAELLVNSVDFWQAAFETNPIAQIVVTHNRQLAAANERARVMLGLSSQNLGCLWQSLPLIAHLVGLDFCFEQVLSNRCPTSLKNIEWSTSKDMTYLDIEIAPILNSTGSCFGVSFTFTDVTRYLETPAVPVEN